MKRTSLRSDKYDKVNTKKICIKLNIKYDSDIIEFLNSLSNKQGYIKNLIRENIQNSSN